jgi:hypothetical protein
LEKSQNKKQLNSFLDPLLFLIYINDIGEKLLSLSRLFADDTSLGYSSQNVVEIENVINHGLIVIGVLFPLNEKLKLYLTSVLENNIISVLSGLKLKTLTILWTRYLVHTSHDL